VDLIKRCPTCGGENAPTAARCGCGAFLLGVDLTERIPIGHTEGAAASIRSDAEMMTPRGDTTAAAVPEAKPAAQAEANVVCRHADCGQPNPPGSRVCVYCNRALATQPEVRSATMAPLPPHTAAAEAKAIRPVPARRSLIHLPAGLAARFDLVDPLKAAGGEADLLIVADKATCMQAVLKLYRHGMEPNTEVLERVSRALPDQLVRLLEYGRDEGVPYELLEYCEHGSLRTLLKGRPLPPEAARTLLTELADAIAHLHECGIVHRDLKPENVLVRGLLPLDLVLTDFGIASVTQATMHYTSAARTLRYSAPEAGSNWVGKATDYWALGMMLVEALGGRHPFEGLSDAVIAHWLVTKPIDVSAIGDPRWQQLCRGLLTRDPKARWGAAEIRRWLAGDQSLAVAEEAVQTPAAALRPYRIGTRECRTPRELAVALAQEWASGVKDLKRGMLRAWLQNDLREQNLARAAADAEEALELSDDERLLRLLLALDPQLPPLFKGYDIAPAGLAALTRKALEDVNEERQAVFELLDRGILSLFPGHALQEVQERFVEARCDFEQALEQAFAAGAPRTLAPQGREWQLRILLFVLEPPKDLLQSLRAAAQRVGGGAARHCAWYRAFGSVETAGPAALAAMVLLGPPAAEQGVQALREQTRDALAALTMTIEGNAVLRARHGGARERLAVLVESSREEAEALALPERVQELAHAAEQSVAALWRDQIFESRAVDDPARLSELRRRIGEWARWRAGDAWAGFGERIELSAAIERRSYRLQLASQIEARRVPYNYGAADVARMPARAREALADVWRCAMPALPAFAADVKLAQALEIRCRRCRASGRVELQESWGSTAYPFSSTFACHDKVGVQCQTRSARAQEDLPASEVPAIVADFIEAHAREDELPDRALELTAPGIPACWSESIGYPPLRSVLRRQLAAAAAEVKQGERVSAQRVRASWTGLTEVRYRFEGRDYVIWIPQRVDALPIALAHPLPSADAAAASERETQRVASQAPEPAQAMPAEPVRGPAPFPPGGRKWLHALLWCAASLGAVWILLGWMVNWKL